MGKPKQEQYNQLAYYTLGHTDPSFLHQNIVDAYAAQTADEDTKPITIAFALIGLYLYLEKGFSGRRVQQAHVWLANRRRQWPAIQLPKQRGDITVADVVATPPGQERDEMIRKWCVSVWEAYEESRGQIVRLLEGETLEK